MLCLTPELTFRRLVHIALWNLNLGIPFCSDPSTLAYCSPIGRDTALLSIYSYPESQVQVLASNAPLFAVTINLFIQVPSIASLNLWSGSRISGSYAQLKCGYCLGPCTTLAGRASRINANCFYSCYRLQSGTTLVERDSAGVGVMKMSYSFPPCG